MKKLISIIILTFSLSTFNLLAQDSNNNPSPSDIEIPLEFESNGFPPRPNELTYQEANIYCEIVQRKNTDDSYTVFTGCMDSFKPYKDPEDDYETCSSQTKVWSSNCSATVPSGGVGETHVVYHDQTGDNYQGSAKYTCLQGQWVLEDPVCINMPDNCPDNAEASWAVTAPEWAVKGGDSTNPRYSPKPDCTATMSKAITGKVEKSVAQDGVLNDAITPWEPVYYDNNYADLKCFNGEWKPYADGEQVCIYEPKGCPATKYVTEDGCTFNLTNADHNQEITINNVQSPAKSQGQVSAFCWDGEWEIKNEACELSCLNDFEPRTWASTPATSRSCYHAADPAPSITPTTRTAPGSTNRILNQTNGLIGEVVRKCEDGFWKIESEYCRPENCSGISGGTWNVNGNTCEHAPNSNVILHGGSIDLPSITSDLNGTKHYYCEFGTIKENSAYDTCKDFGDKRCYANEPELTGQYVMEYDIWHPTCNATCRRDNNSDYVYCSAECLPDDNPHCTSPLSEEGGSYAELTNTSCNVKVAQDHNTLVDDNIGKVLRKYSCTAGTWSQVGTECVVEYNKEITVVKPTAPNFTPTPGVDCSATTISHPYTSESGQSYTFNFSMPNGEHDDSPIQRTDTINAASGDTTCSSKEYIAEATATCSSSKWNVNTVVECKPLTPVQNEWNVEIYCANEGGALTPSVNGDCSNAQAQSDNETWSVITPIIEDKLSSQWNTTNACNGRSCQWTYTVMNTRVTGDVTGCNITRGGSDYIEVTANVNTALPEYNGSCTADINVSVSDNEGKTVNINTVAKATANKDVEGTWNRTGNSYYVSCEPSTAAPRIEGRSCPTIGEIKTDGIVQPANSPNRTNCVNGAPSTCATQDIRCSVEFECQ
tara:strand:- start:50683 stop:53328 length:2646 start_codon:yes stop_codon:yes gene_type:complete